MENDRSVSGACLCGAVRFEVDLPTSFCAHCHCGMCRRNHGAGYVTWVGLPDSQFRILAGEDQLVAYVSSEHGVRSFCRTCGSSLTCVSSHHPGRVDVPLANFHGAIDREPQLHFYFDDRADWVAVADDLPKLGGKSGIEPRSDGD